MKDRKYMRNQFIVCLITLVSLACHAQTFRWATQGDALTLDPHARNEQLTNNINGQIYEPLVSRDKQLNIVPSLAVSWDRISPVRWRFNLRKGVRFHDGSTLTADDVVFSVLRAQAPTSGFLTYASALGTPTKIDEITVEFVTPQFNPIFLQHLAFVQIMSKSWAEKFDAIQPQDFKTGEIKYTTTHANGTGPYLLVSRQVDQRTTFRKNQNWWGAFEGNVQEVIFSPIKADSTRTAALVTGEVELVLDPVTQDIARLRETNGVKIVDGLENRLIYLGFDQARSELLYSDVKGKNPFKDIRVRKALYHAIDIDTIRRKLMSGHSMPTGSMTPSPMGSFNDPAIEGRLPFDQAAARNLLTQAGYPEGFGFTLDCPNNRYINDEEICLALSSMWAQVGLKVKVNAMPRALYFAKGEKLDISAFLSGWGGSVTDAETTLTNLLRSRGAKGVGYSNWGDYKNARLDELAAASSIETDATKRESLIKAALREHNEQIHHIPLHRQVIPWAMRSNVTAVHRADNWLEWRWVTVAAK